MSYFNPLHCCGVKELASIRDHRSPLELLRYQRQDLQIFRGKFILFTQAGTFPPTKGYGEKLAKYIIDNGLGTATMAGEGVNPNSNNLLKVFVWTVDLDGLKRFLGEEKFMGREGTKK